MAGEVTGPNLGIVYGWNTGDDSWKPGMDLNLQRVDGILALAVLALAQNTPPTSNNGDRYTVGASPSGAFAGRAQYDVAVRAEGAWRFYVPKLGWRLWDVGTAQFYYHTGSAWAVEPISLAGKTTTNLPEGTNLYYTETRVSANTQVAAATAHVASTSNPHATTETQAAAAGRIPKQSFSGAGPFSPAAATDMVFVALGSGSAAITFPAGSPTAGRRCYVKKTTTDLDVLTLTPASGNIEGAASYPIGALGRDQLVLTADGTDWWLQAS